MIATCLSALVCATLLVPSLEAKTFVVAPNGPLTSIQDAIDLAGDDDTILVKAGVYVETLRIIGKDGLELRGLGSVIVDGRELGSTGDGPAITIEADDVTLRGLTIRNARAVQNDPASIGAGVFATGAGLRLKLVRIENCSRAVVATGNGARVDDCKIASSRIDIVGNDARIDDTVFVNCDNSAIDVDGDDARITDCVIDGVTDGAAIVLQGDDAFIEDVTIRSTETGGIELDGNRATIRKCAVDSSSEVAFIVQGTEATLHKLRVDGATTGISVIGAEAEITACRLDRLFDGDAIRIEAAPQSVVTDNRVKFSSAVGIRIGANSGGTLVARNVVQRCSNEGAAGFDLQSDDVTMFDNLAKDNARHGLRILGVGCDVESFTATRNLRDGIRLEATASGTRLTDVLATKNGEHGLANLANGVELRIAVLLANRLDLANDGTFAVLDQVQFQTGGANVDVETN